MIDADLQCEADVLDMMPTADEKSRRESSAIEHEDSLISPEEGLTKAANTSA
ncbi:MAG: hypothetical protein HY820_36565 [Acidobacteria bacterium]|nr:hypothetical protein [Acidobacteriota bacterium]